MRVVAVHRADHGLLRRFIVGFGGPALFSLLGLAGYSATDVQAAGDPPLAAYDLFPNAPWARSDSLDILELSAPDTATPARIGGVGRLSGSDDPTDSTLGVGGVDLAWRPDDRISVAMIAGGVMDRFDRSGFDPAGMEPDFRSDRSDPLGSLAGRSTAFDGLDFGGFSAADVIPFDAGRAMAPVATEDRLRSMFLATRAVLKPVDGTSIGFIATHGGSVEEDRSLIGVDLGQKLGSHHLDVWFQQSLGSIQDDAVSSQDRMALGASIGGSVDRLRYSVGWRQVGEAFDSGLGRSGSGGANSVLGSVDWSVPISGLDFIDRVELGVAAAIDADAEFDPNAVNIEIDAIRFVTSMGHRVELGMVQELKPDPLDGEGLSSTERYRVAVVSDPSADLKLHGRVDLGEYSSDTAATWNGAARWNPGGGFHIGGSVHAETRTDEIELRETLRTSVDGGFHVGEHAAVQSSLGFDAARDRLSLGHSVGWSFQSNAKVSIRVEQQLPIMSSASEALQVRATIGGKFEF